MNRQSKTGDISTSYYKGWEQSQKSIQGSGFDIDISKVILGGKRNMPEKKR